MVDQDRPCLLFPGSHDDLVFVRGSRLAPGKSLDGRRFAKACEAEGDGACGQEMIDSSIVDLDGGSINR
jgi:hypothetical protein